MTTATEVRKPKTSAKPKRTRAARKTVVKPEINVDPVQAAYDHAKAEAARFEALAGSLRPLVKNP